MVLFSLGLHVLLFFPSALPPPIHSCRLQEPISALPWTNIWCRWFAEYKACEEGSPVRGDYSRWLGTAKEAETVAQKSVLKALQQV